MDRVKIELVTELRKLGHDTIADNLLTLIELREKRIQGLEEKVVEFSNRYETVRMALDHFVKTELEHYTEIKSAFPDGDCQGHKVYHDKLIKAAEAQEEFYVAMRNEIIKKGTWFAILALLGVIWVGFQVKIKGLLGL